MCFYLKCIYLTPLIGCLFISSCSTRRLRSSSICKIFLCVSSTFARRCSLVISIGVNEIVTASALLMIFLTSRICSLKLACKIYEKLMTYVQIQIHPNVSTIYIKLIQEKYSSEKSIYVYTVKDSKTEAKGCIQLNNMKSNALSVKTLFAMMHFHQRNLVSPVLVLVAQPSLF